jgi:hypothetical protein
MDTGALWSAMVALRHGLGFIGMLDTTRKDSHAHNCHRDLVCVLTNVESFEQFHYQQLRLKMAMEAIILQIMTSCF